MKNVIVALALLLAVAAPARAQLSPMNAAGVTYGHVHLNVSDIEVQKKLWVDLFGGTYVQKGPLMTVKYSNMLVALTLKAPTGPSQGTVMDHFGFKVKSMPDMLAAVRAAGYAYVSLDLRGFRSGALNETLAETLTGTLTQIQLPSQLSR